MAVQWLISWPFLPDRHLSALWQTNVETYLLIQSTFEIHDSLNQFGAHTHRLLMSIEEEDTTLTDRITKDDDVIQTSDIKALIFVLWIGFLVKEFSEIMLMCSRSINFRICMLRTVLCFFKEIWHSIHFIVYVVTIESVVITVSPCIWMGPV